MCKFTVVLDAITVACARCAILIGSAMGGTSLQTSIDNMEKLLQDRRGSKGELNSTLSGRLQQRSVQLVGDCACASPSCIADADVTMLMNARDCRSLLHLEGKKLSPFFVPPGAQQHHRVVAGSPNLSQLCPIALLPSLW